MTKNDVISAAFRVWGQELYKTTSLAKLAEALGVSKPALYRHFQDKEALLEAMKERYYDDFAVAISPIVEEAKKNSNWQDKLLIMVQFISGYFTRHFGYFLYSLIKLHNSQEQHFFDMKPMLDRGIFLDDIHEELNANNNTAYPSALFLAGMTALFGTGMFHKQRQGINDSKMSKKRLEETWFSEQPDEEEISHFTGDLIEKVRQGLGFDMELVDALSYEELENLDLGIYDPPDPLLKAAAEAVAKKGPWDASMNMVAKQSGLSKSGLYAHFKSKEEMLSRLFLTEFDRISQYTSSHTASAETQEKQLYLAILSIAAYLHARPEILIVMHWVRIQGLELDLPVPKDLSKFFTGIKTAALFNGNRENISKWILFLLAAVLKHCNATKLKEKTVNLDYYCLRRLFRFICLGLEGLEEVP
ncbi:MAG: TetR/AcrR family transcriptional regulator [Treponema sp.]|jgi:AcrR family transcriptional regulator|nr:TetR/AcrR family transcriptional regulator [Treponema sp.]